MKELIAALVKAKQEFSPIVKDRQGVRSKYATLDSVHNSIDKALGNNGLVVVQPMSFQDGQHVLKTVLWHVSGESLESGYYPIPSNPDPQKVGANITYARRYQLCALLGLTADEDTDAESINGNQSNTRENSPRKATSPLVATVKENIADAMDYGMTPDEIRALCSENGLPTSSEKYKTQSQVVSLSGLLQDEIAKRQKAMSTWA
jgi:hypothetical protein